MFQPQFSVGMHAATTLHAHAQLQRVEVGFQAHGVYPDDPQRYYQISWVRSGDFPGLPLRLITCPNPINSWRSPHSCELRDMVNEEFNHKLFNYFSLRACWNVCTFWNHSFIELQSFIEPKGLGNFRVQLGYGVKFRSDQVGLVDFGHEGILQSDGLFLTLITIFDIIFFLL